MEAHAVAKHVRVSARKARLLADLIRGKRVEEALNLLHFNKKQAAIHVEKTVRSAVANLMHKMEGDLQVPPEAFIVKEAYVNEGATMKRWRPRAHGRAAQILKRTSHITIKVSDGLTETAEV
jgi:large subunit ribosomal protein L22